MNTIVLTTDFSEFAHNAGKYALHLAQKIKANISLFHAYHVPVIDPMTPAEYLKELSDSVKKDAEEKLAEEKNKLKSYAKKIGYETVEINTDSSFGFAVGEIIAHVKKQNPRLLVMGTRHMGGLEKAIFGSVNQPILERAEVPVLLVPGDAQFEEEAPKILYATDFKEKDTDAISTLLEFAVLLGSEVHCVHFDLDGFVNIDRADMEEIEARFEAERKAGHIDFEIVSADNLEEGMDQYIKDRQIDLLAMLTKKRSLFEKILESSKTKA
ncbi:MAG: universal stress protein, partial [Chitinophagales bacterium]